MDRRTFLKSAALAAGVLSSGGVLTACGGSGGGIPGGEPTLSVITGSFEILRGPSRRLAFGVRRAEDNTPVEGEPVQAYLRDADGQTVLAGPLETEYTEDAGEGLGVYLVTLDLSQDNVPQGIRPFLVAVVGDAWGEAALNVVAPEDSALPVPGDQAQPVPTPTVTDDLGYTRICTEDPPCGMHEVSLDDALAAGRPVALLFATPAFCQTAVCGPAVATLDEVRQSRDWGDTAFIHVEIFSDDGKTVADPVLEWGLPTEPWLFTIGADGTIVDRLDGPMVSSVVSDMVAEIAGGGATEGP